MEGFFTVVFQSNYATVYFMDKPMFDVMFSHSVDAKINQGQKEFMRQMMEDINTHHVRCSNAA